MSRRVAFTTLSPEAAAKTSQMSSTSVKQDAMPTLTGVQHLNNMVNNWDHLTAGGTADLVPKPYFKKAPAKPRRISQNNNKKKKKTTTKANMSYRQKLLQAATSPLPRSRSHVTLGIPLTQRTTLRSLLWRLPWTKQPLSQLMNIEGWLNHRATLRSIINRIPQAKLTITTSGQGVKR